METPTASLVHARAHARTPRLRHAPAVDDLGCYDAWANATHYQVEALITQDETPYKKTSSPSPSSPGARQLRCDVALRRQGRVPQLRYEGGSCVAATPDFGLIISQAQGVLCRGLACALLLVVLTAVRRTAASITDALQQSTAASQTQHLE